MIRQLRQRQHTGPTLPGCDLSCGILPRQIGWGGYGGCFYYSGALCFAPRRSRQK
jgi:hypothetical protein